GQGVWDGERGGRRRGPLPPLPRAGARRGVAAHGHALERARDARAPPRWPRLPDRHGPRGRRRLTLAAPGRHFWPRSLRTTGGIVVSLTRRVAEITMNEGLDA